MVRFIPSALLTGALLVSPRLDGLSSKSLLVTIPKTGTHLIEKCETLLYTYTYTKNNKRWTWNNPYNLFNKDKSVTNVPARSWIATFWKKDPVDCFNYLEKVHSDVDHLSIRGHIVFDQRLAAELSKRGYKVILNIRDPRDQIVSAVHWIRKVLPDFMNVPFDEMVNTYCVSSHLPMTVGVDGYWHFLQWLTYPNVLLVKFENLVGTQGGGSYDQQLREIQRICSHLDLAVSPEDLSTLIYELFGNTTTFRQGKIGAWKHEFTPENKECFKNIPGANELLIRLGYEKDEHW